VTTIVKTPAAVGETGLDRWMKDYDFELQQAVLRRHLEFAAELERPVTIHCFTCLASVARSAPEHTTIRHAGFSFIPAHEAEKRATR